MITLHNDRLEFRFPDLHPDAGVSINLQRTLRLPDDGNTHHLPPGLGAFPLRHIEDYHLGEKEHLKARGGVIMPMFQADALWLNFNSFRGDHFGKSYPVAIKIGTGKVCAVSGDEWNGHLNQDPQDYVVAPKQPWLDGYNVGEGKVRQFVAAPLGEGLTVEEQIRQTADVGGIQIQVFPMKRDYYDKLNHRKNIRDGRIMYCFRMPMGLAPGGEMHQKIYDDPYEMSAWDQRQSQRCFITIANATEWMAITGEEPPMSPISADAYTDAGLPWFSYYDADQKVIKGAKKLKILKSFQKGKADLGQLQWIKEKITGKPVVIPTTGKPVSSGHW